MMQGDFFTRWLVALRSDGTVTGYPTNILSVTQAVGIQNLVAISAGGGYASEMDGNACLGLRNDGTVVAWGFNGQGETNVPPFASTAGAIAANAYGTCGAILTDGSPCIYRQPICQHVYSSSTPTISVWAAGLQPLQFQWRLNGTNIPSATDSTIAIANAQVTDSGSYDVIISNSVGVVTSTTATLVVSNSQPIIYLQPSNQVILPGFAATVSVGADGSQPLSYQWRFNDVDLPNATNAALTFQTFDPVNAGTYDVVITNIFGKTTSSSATLTAVSPAIQFISQPQSQWVVFDGSMLLTVGVIGAPPLGYQWQKGGTPIAGATDTAFLLKNIQPSDIDAYTVVVTNIYGSATSSAAVPNPVNSLVLDWSNSTTNFLLLPPYSATNTVAVAADEYHTYTLDADGTIVSWPHGYYSPYYTSRLAGLSNIISIAGGAFYGLGLKSDGTVVGWGDNSFGQRSIPLNLSNVVQIGAGYIHSAALRSDGTVVVWGGMPGPPPYLTNVVSIAVGDGHTVALTRDGAIVDWSGNATNIFPPDVFYPQMIAASGSSTLALRPDGTLAAWGNTFYGESNVPSGLTNVVTIAGGADEFVAAIQDMGVISWGQSNAATFLTPVLSLACDSHNTVALLRHQPRRAALKQPAWSNNAFTVSIPTISGRTYSLEYTTSLTNPNWKHLPLVAGTGADQLLIDPGAGAEERYYRVRQW